MPPTWTSTFIITFAGAAWDSTWACRQDSARQSNSRPSSLEPLTGRTLSVCSHAAPSLSSSSTNAAEDDSGNHDDFTRMQLKIADSTTGLSDKDVKRLTQLKHVVPRDFHELSLLMKNLAGVTALVFGGASPLTSILNGWVRFLTVSGGSVVSGLRHLAAVDKSGPSRVGWFVDRRIQQ